MPTAEAVDTGVRAPEARRTRWSPSVEVLAAIALGLLYLTVMSGHLHSMDGLFMYRQAWSIAFDHSIRFETPVWIWKPEPVWNSKYGIGLSLLYLPGILLFHRWFGHTTPISLVQPEEIDPFYWSELYLDRLYTVGASWVHAVIVAVAAYLVARLIRELGFDRRASLWGMGFYGLGSSAIIYARGDFAQPLEGLLWTGALIAAVRFRRTLATRYLWFASGLVFYAILTRPIEGVFLVPAVLLVVALEERSGGGVALHWTRLGPIVLGAALAVAVTLLVNWARFGDPLTTGYEPQEGWRVPDRTRVLGVLISPARGIIWEFPALLLVPLGVRTVWLTRWRWVAVAIGGVVLVQLANVTTWLMWWGGWNWGLRLFTPANPLLAVLAGIGAGALRPSWRPWVPGLLLIAGLVWASPGVITDLLGGYGQMADGPHGSWRWDAFPPYGAWQFMHHWRAQAPIDWHAADILWFRLMRTRGVWALVPPALFSMAAAALAGRIWWQLRSDPGATKGI